MAPLRCTPRRLFPSLEHMTWRRNQTVASPREYRGPHGGDLTMATPRERSFERQLEAEVCERERGTWRELLRLRYPEWTQHLQWGFQHGDGWRSVTENLLRDLAGMLGADASKLEVRQVK